MNGRIDECRSGRVWPRKQPEMGRLHLDLQLHHFLPHPWILICQHEIPHACQNIWVFSPKQLETSLHHLDFNNSVCRCSHPQCPKCPELRVRKNRVGTWEPMAASLVSMAVRRLVRQVTASTALARVPRRRDLYLNTATRDIFLSSRHKVHVLPKENSRRCMYIGFSKKIKMEESVSGVLETCHVTHDMSTCRHKPGTVNST